ncbi:MAG: ATP-binding protein [Phycisphaerae bacterium]|nr:ATP-binding protein [Phycisphaerae bacterium]
MLADPDNEATFKVLTVPGSLQRVRKAADAILQDVEAAGYTTEAVFAIKLALEEAITNAIKHGHSSDSSKPVTLCYAVSAEKCVIIIRDQGGGFNPREVPDCTKAERLALPYGRGIMLMRTYMDRVSYRKHGSEIYLMKRNK